MPSHCVHTLLEAVEILTGVFLLESTQKWHCLKQILGREYLQNLKPDPNSLLLMRGTSGTFLSRSFISLFPKHNDCLQKEVKRDTHCFVPACLLLVDNLP